MFYKKPLTIDTIDIQNISQIYEQQLTIEPQSVGTLINSRDKRKA